MKLSVAHPNFAAIHFPYCLQQLGDSTWIILNREYRPLGVNMARWVDHELTPIDCRIARILPSQRKKLCCEGDGSGRRIYLYKGSIPIHSAPEMAAYLRRLGILMRFRAPDRDQVWRISNLPLLRSMERRDAAKRQSQTTATLQSDDSTGLSEANPDDWK